MCSIILPGREFLPLSQDLITVGSCPEHQVRNREGHFYLVFSFHHRFLGLIVRESSSAMKYSIGLSAPIPSHLSFLSILLPSTRTLVKGQNLGFLSIGSSRCTRPIDSSSFGWLIWVQTGSTRVDRGLPREMGVPPGDPKNTKENLRHHEVKER